MAHANRFGKVGLLRKEQIWPTITGFPVTFKNIQCCTECLTSKNKEKVEKITKSPKEKSSQPKLEIVPKLQIFAFTVESAENVHQVRSPLLIISQNS